MIIFFFRVKKESSAYIKKKLGTGGGPQPPPPKYDPLTEAAAALMECELKFAEYQYSSSDRDLPPSPDQPLIVNSCDIGKNC